MEWRVANSQSFLTFMMSYWREESFLSGEELWKTDDNLPQELFFYRQKMYSQQARQARLAGKAGEADKTGEAALLAPVGGHFGGEKQAVQQ